MFPRRFWKAIDCGGGMVRMTDIATKAGVSVTTVSHVLNESRPVREETVVRVRTAAEELGYRPNKLARSLRRKQSLTIGLIVPDISNAFFAEIGRGLTDASFDAGYTVIIGNTGGDQEQERRNIAGLLEKQVDGIVVALAGMAPAELETIVGSAIPIVIIDRDVPGASADVVLANNAAGGMQAVAHLAGLGHRRIACIVSRAASRASEPGRLHGYREGMRRANLDPSGLVVITDELEAASQTAEIDAGYLATQRVLNLQPRPTAIFLTNDLMAIGALRAAHDHGVSVPGDLSIVGFDDILLARFTIPALTTVIQPRDDMGRIAAQLLIARVNDNDRPPVRRMLDVTLVQRESSGPANLADERHLP
jgi:LacI family transcriptional regulator